MASDAEKWECSACTYLNPRALVICEICETARERPRPRGGGHRASSSSSSSSSSLSSSSSSSSGESALGNRVSQGLFLGAIGAGGLAFLRGSSMSDVFREAVNGATIGALAGNLIEQTSSMEDHIRERERERRRVREEEEAEMFRRLEMMLSQRAATQRITTRFNGNDAFMRDMIQGMFQGMSPRDIHHLIHERYTPSGSRGMEILTEEIDNLSYEELVERYPQNPIPAPTSAVNDLVEFKYSKIDSTESDEGDLERDCEECSVCLAKFVQDEYVKLLPCSHKFHKHCIDEWLSRSGMCPICKYRIGGEGGGSMSTST